MAEDFDAEDLAKLWEQALEEYRVRTGDDLRDEPPMNMEQMSQKLSQSFPGEGKNEIVKKSLERAFQLGDMAAELASEAWPPAGVFYKAAQSIVEVAKHYQQYYTAKSVHKTLEGILPHFSRVEGYVEYARQGARVDAKLAATIFNILHHFLNICAIYSNVVKSSARNRGKFKNFCKSVIGLDGGIQQELEQMNNFVQQELLQNVADTRGTLLVAESHNIRARNRKLIKEVLKIEVSDAFSNSWIGTQQELRRTYVEGIGSWLPDIAEFSSWTDIWEAANPVLALRADTGLGKSYLCSEIVAILQKNQMGKEKTVFSVAYLYLKNVEVGETSKSMNRTQKSSTLDPGYSSRTLLYHALKALVWQLVLCDEEYQRFVAGRIGHTAGFFADELDIWNKLVKEYAKFGASRRQKLFFLVLDGIDVFALGEMGAQLRQIVEDIAGLRSSKFQIRLLLTGTCKSFHDLGLSDKDSSIPDQEDTAPGEDSEISRDSISSKNSTLKKNTTLIDIDEYRAEDLKRFIESKISSVASRHKEDDDKINLLRRVETKFCQLYKSSDYSTVQAALDEVEWALGDYDLNEILHRSPEDSSSAVSWRLERFSRDMSHQEIAEFNNVLLCVVLMKSWPSIKQLKAFLWLENPNGNHNELEDRIRNRYARFFNVSESEVVSSPATKEYFLSLRQQLSKVKPTGALSTGGSDQMHTDSEIALIQNVAFSVCKEGLRSRVERFFEELKAPKPSVELKLPDGHVKIILRLLQSVCTELRKHSRSIHHYAAVHLFAHLADMDSLGLARIPAGTREEVGYLLYKFFMDETSVQTWMTQGFATIADEPSKWLDSLEKVLEWFKDGSVKKGAQLAENEVVGDDKDSISTFFGEERNESEASVRNVTENATQKKYQESNEEEREENSDKIASLSIEGLLMVPQRIVAWRWLNDFQWDALKCFTWLRQTSKGMSKNPEELEKISEVDPGWSSILAFELWALKIIDAEKIPRSRRNTRIGETAISIPGFVSRSDKRIMSDAIVRRCQTATKDCKTNWRAVWCILNVHLRNSERGAALGTLPVLLDTLQEEEFRNGHKNYHDEILDPLLKLFEESDSPYRTMRIFGDLSEKFPEDIKLIERGIKWVGNQDNPALLTRLLHTLAAAPEKGGLSPMTNLFHERAEQSRFHHKIWLALIDEPGLTIKCYMDAIKGADRLSVVKKSHICFNYGLALYHQQKVREAAGVWEKIQIEPSDLTEYPKLRLLQAKRAERLALCYIQLAKESRSQRSASLQETEFSQKFRDLLKGNEDDPMTNKHYLKLSVGRIYHLKGHAEKAKRQVRDSINEALELITDATYDNDNEGYVTLGRIFIALGDNKNAYIAWSMINPSEYGHPFTLPVVCDGECGHAWNNYPEDEMWICRDCAQVHLDKKCYERLREGKMKHRVCGKDHDFFQVQKWDGKVKKEARDRIDAVGSLSKWSEQWKNEVENEYGISHFNVKPDLGLRARARNAVENTRKLMRKREKDPGASSTQELGRKTESNSEDGDEKDKTESST